MNILALDLSIAATGICSPSGDLTTFKPKSAGEHRFDEIAAHVRDLVVSTKAEMVVMEDVFIGQNASSSKPLCMLHGAVRLQLMRKKIPYAVVSPMSLKKFATSKHQAKKPDMRMAWYKRTGKDNADVDQVDAAWLFTMAHQAYGSPRFEMPAANCQAIEKVAWPAIPGRAAVKKIIKEVAAATIPFVDAKQRERNARVEEIPVEQWDPKVRQTPREDAIAAGKCEDEECCGHDKKVDYIHSEDDGTDNDEAMA